VQTKLNKFFPSYLKGTEGWVYAAQSKWQPSEIFERLIQAYYEKSSIEDVLMIFRVVVPIQCNIALTPWNLTKSSTKSIVSSEK